MTIRMISRRRTRFSAVIVLFQLLLPLLLFSQERQKFLYYTDIDGLPQNITTSLEQDKYGYIWVGTGNGVARYDGNTFATYDQFKSIFINCLYIDSKNNLWVGANNGLYLYNRLTNFFELKSKGYIQKIQEDRDEIYSLHAGLIQRNSPSGNTAVKIENDFLNFCITEEGIWLCCKKKGAKLLSRKSGFQTVSDSILDGYSISVISAIGNNLFFGCRNGQLFVKKSGGRLRNISIGNHHNFKKIVQVDDEIWLTTDGNGIMVLDADLTFSRFLNRNQGNNLSISSNSIYDILQGSNREIWIASYGAGLTCMLPDNSLFTNIVPEKGNPNSLVASEGVAAFVKNGIFHFGTNYGMSVWNEEKDVFTNFSMNQLRNELGGAKVLGLVTDNQNNVWVGTHDGLLGKYSPEYQFLKSFHPSSSNPDEMQQIVLMHNYNNTNIVLGTQYQDQCLLNFDLKTETVSTLGLKNGSKKITHFQINSIRENQQGEILALHSDSGLYRINFKKNILENSLPELNKRIKFWINDFYNDKSGNYWFTTKTEGLIRISADGSQFKKWTLKEGFPTNSLIRIESVDDRFLWISSIAGLCRFEMKTGQVINFNYRDGLPANEFTDRNSAKTEDGRIIFGSVAGFTIVNPANVVTDTTKTEVIISDITFQNQSIRNPQGKQFLTAPLEETTEIKLPFSRNSFTVHFFTRNKDIPKYNNYSYRMTGLEKDWTFLSETNHINYTNLSPGTYVFEVKNASTAYTENSPPTQLMIRINPPWYLSWYAFAGYFALFSGIAYLLLSIYTNRVQLKKEVEISEFKVQKEHELTEKKLAFFTNISHDLKTPLTLIDTPVNDLIQSKNLNPEQVNKLLLIRRNSKRLYNLISDLLDFRKLTQKQFELKVSETNIQKLIEEVSKAFDEECKNKSVNLKWSAGAEFTAWIDVRKIERILWNLLSNAVKFTEKEGQIFLGAEIKMHDGTKVLELIVKDSGIGISEADQARIFEHFYQVHNSKKTAQEGTGIGLSIVKELVDLHHGEILVDSIPDAGTTFRITIPAEKNQYSTEEIETTENRLDLSVEIKPKTDWPVENDPDQTQKFYNRPRILVVEDNSELRNYLVGHFQKAYKVDQAEDGKRGLEIALEINPDLILTDVQMPNMNGYEFCREIRQNFDTSHIPVVMLTANSAVEQQIEGLSTGADAYVTKPFDIELLDTVLLSVLENRKKLRHKFLGVEPAGENENTIPQKDLDFILEIKRYIEQNMVNPDLNIDMISEHFSLSRTQLNRKIKSLTGSTPNNLIKTIRLKKAYQLIRQKDARVSEVAYLTGFSDPNYFTTCFKKEFGENPSQIGVE